MRDQQEAQANRKSEVEVIDEHMPPSKKLKLEGNKESKGLKQPSSNDRQVSVEEFEDQEQQRIQETVDKLIRNKEKARLLKEK